MKNWSRIQNYGGRIVSAVRAAIRRPAQTAHNNRIEAVRSACIEREQYNAESHALLQSARYFR